MVNFLNGNTDNKQIDANMSVVHSTINGSDTVIGLKQPKVAMKIAA